MPDAPTIGDTAGAATDPAALIDRHQAGVWRYLRMLGCDPALADDLTQDTFLQLLQGPFEHRSDATTGAWLRRTATSLFRKLLRRKRLADAVAESALEEAEAAWERWHRSGTREDAAHVTAALGDCLQQLTGRAQLALRLQHQEQLGGAEIADALDMTHSNVRVLLHRSREALRTCVEQKLAGDTRP